MSPDDLRLYRLIGTKAARVGHGHFFANLHRFPRPSVSYLEVRQQVRAERHRQRVRALAPLICVVAMVTAWQPAIAHGNVNARRSFTSPTLFNDVVNSGETFMPKPTVEEYIDAATEGQRASHPFDTKSAAEVLEVHPNRVGDWANRTEDKLTRLARRQPAQVAAFCLRILARAYATKGER